MPRVANPAAAGGTSLGSLGRNRWVLAAAGVAAAAGLVSLLVHQRAGGAAGGATIQPAAGFDSTGTDVYNAIQDLGQGWQRDLQGFTDTLQNVSDQLNHMPATGTGAASPDQYAVGTGQILRHPPTNTIGINPPAVPSPFAVVLKPRG